MKKNFYAVKKGRTPGIYQSWEACKEQTEGFSGAEYAGFATEEEARTYLKESIGVPPEYIPPKGHITAYVDGSYRHADGRYAFGCVLLLPSGEMVCESGSGDDPESAQLRNVTGEMLGAMAAVKWCLQQGYRYLDLYYDYMGIEMWATGRWKANLGRTQAYAAYMKSRGERLQITFHKVKAHTGDRFNEMADQLAKAALDEKRKNA